MFKDLEVNVLLVDKQSDVDRLFVRVEICNLRKVTISQCVLTLRVMLLDEKCCIASVRTTYRVANARGYSTMFYTGWLRTEIKPLTLIQYYFDNKGTPFVYL